ncbi:alternative ribosome rescue aminoacyl-tRNA hydrolase ArfB [uncultured Hymenobacter sp.]|uniref:alternative ribosome rescue aminoacyl-tRNA hydrolase ArfB n=1 Tax=uncultured Hymenobacter sp. TaxID=170016 RepID=UPI0035CA227F
MLPPANAFLPEINFQTSRSSGPGGQNVNKVESRVELRFVLADSQLLSAEQKERLQGKLRSRLTAEGVLLITAQEDRSQLRNKDIALRKLHELLRQGLHQDKPRKATKPSKSAVRKRLETKKKDGEKKASRRRVE